ncbi:MAG: hypothetical protein F2799_01095 [Actinobacteria bacterium]|nr:hypothetical protein [Actinomycetota bacterium]
MPVVGSLQQLVSLLIPPVCLGCGCEPMHPRAVLCGECAESMPLLTGRLCQRCALPVPCDSCPAHGSPWESSTAACSHEGPARGLVIALKSSGAKRVAAQMAKLMAEAALPTEGVALVPMPPDPARLRATGVDHARILAEQLSGLTGRPVLRVLERLPRGQSVRQVGASRQERQQPGRIQISGRGTVPSRCVVVDDVYTTGASLQAACSGLLLSGAQVVHCAVFARALPPGFARPMPRSW